MSANRERRRKAERREQARRSVRQARAVWRGLLLQTYGRVPTERVLDFAAGAGMTPVEWDAWILGMIDRSAASLYTDFARAVAALVLGLAECSGWTIERSDGRVDHYRPRPPRGGGVWDSVALLRAITSCDGQL
jgi:hypothetical protein